MNVHEVAGIRLPGFPEVVAAAGRLAPHLARTPVVSSARFDARVGRRVFLKCENLQHGGAFKFRGAMNAVLQVPPDVATVATHSSGNHGAALALAARLRGLRCVVVAPSDASAVKLSAIREAGGEVIACSPGLAAREAAFVALLARSPAHVVHPFDDARVIAGQGTAALELLAEAPTLDVLTVPVGGGGLLGGTALAAVGAAPACRVVAVEPALADDAWRSFRSGTRESAEGSPATIADGLRGSIGVLNFALLRRHVHEVITVTEAEIVHAMRVVLEDFRLLVEPSSAVPLAALLGGRIGAPGQAIGVIVSGGNVDLGACPFFAGQRAG